MTADVGRSSEKSSATEANPDTSDSYREILDASSELVDDRELEDLSQDRFRHSDVADLLCDIAAGSRMPANVGLFGPWGSGKSGISNLTKDRFADREFVKAHGRSAFFRFDAFQYSGDLPLRRAFLINLASELHSSKRAEKDRAALYASETSNVFDPSRFWPVAWRYLALLAGLLGSVTFIAALIGSVGPDAFTESLEDAASTAILPAIAPSVLIAGLMAFLSNQLTVTRTTLPPATDDQFETIFTKLVSDILKKNSAKRLVVFVDELDRCPAARVVDVLDTIRTFLEAPDTIFVVAADREVLEKALSEKVSQSTPTDLINPYYSSGSEYLDKVFHYQVSLAPLLPQRVTTYAVGLVEEQSGMWAEPIVRSHIPQIMSVLIPSHVRSPRRVKTLLNNYAIAYHTAKRRAMEGQLDIDPNDRLLELAKLVCLRTEFPRFGRDLALSDRLPDYFRLLAQGKEKPDHVPVFVWQAVKSYFRDVETVDTMLDRRGEGQPAGEPEEDDELVNTTHIAIRRQLDQYLQKTSRIPNPRRDLIFMEQTGHTYGLPSDVADELENLAVENRRPEIRQLVENDASLNEPMIRFLSGLAVQSFPGVEGDNVVSALLATCDSAHPEAVESAAGQAINAVMTHRTRSDLAEDDLSGALALGLMGDGKEAEALVADVLAHPSATENEAVGMSILRRLDQLPDLRDPALGAVITSFLFRSDGSQGFLAVLADQSEVNIGMAIEGMNPIAVRELNRICELGEDDDQARVDAFLAVLRTAWESDPSVVREGILEVWLRSECDQIQAAEVMDIIEGTSLKIGSSMGAVLEKIPSLAVEDVPRWLRMIEPDDADESLGPLVSDAIGSVWKRRAGFDESQLDDALDGLGRLTVSTGARRKFRMTDQPLGSLPLVQAQTRLWTDALKFEAAGTHTGAGDFVVGEVAAAFGAATPATPAEANQLANLLADWARRGLDSAGSARRVELAKAVHACSWMEQGQHLILCLELAASAASAGIPDDERRNLRGQHETPEIADEALRDPVSAIPLVAQWLVEFAEGPGDVVTLVEPYLAGSTYSSDELRSAVRSVSNRLSDDARLELAAREISAQRRTSRRFLEDLSFDTLDESQAAELIVNVFSNAGNLRDQQEALDLWKLLNPGSSAVRRTLIERVLIAGLEGSAGRGWLDLLLKNEYVRIWEDPPRGTKEAIKQAMAPHATDQRRRKVRKALSRNKISTTGFAGLIERFFGSADEDD